jgi:hypothetical protein
LLLIIASPPKSRADPASGLKPSGLLSPISQNPKDWTIIGEYTEIETGKGADALDRRPKLAAAVKAARKQDASVCVAKLDRLSRDVHFISG